MDIDSSRIVSQFDLWSYTYDTDITASTWGFEYYNDAIEWICRQLVSNHRCEKVIDLGCGTGILAEKLHRIKSTIEYIGIDISPRMLNIAREKASTSSFIQADMRNYSKWDRHLVADCACVIVSTYALHHIHDKDKISLFKHVFSTSAQQDLQFIVVDYAFIDQYERKQTLYEQNNLGRTYITEEIESEHYANLCSLGYALKSQSIDLSFAKNGIWDWRILIQRWHTNASSFATI